MAGRHWEHQPGWRPKHDLNGRYAINPTNLVPNSPPATAADALAEVRESGEFDGYFNSSVFEQMVQEAAEERFPACFNLPSAAPETPQTVQKSRYGSVAVEAFFADYMRPDGHIDWNAVAQNTNYVVTVTPVLPHLEVVAPPIDQQRKVG